MKHPMRPANALKITEFFFYGLCFFLFLIFLALPEKYLTFFLALKISVPVKHFDFLNFYSACKLWEGGASPYRDSLSAVNLKNAPLMYSPLFFLAFLPFCNLPVSLAIYFWDVHQLLFLLAGILLCCRVFQCPRDPSYVLKIFSLSLFCFPFLFSIELGQTSLWMLFAVVLSLYFTAKKKDPLAAYPVLFITFIKLTPAVFLTYFLRRLKTTWVSLLMAAIMLSGICLLFFHDETKTYLFSVLPGKTEVTPFIPNQSPDAFLKRAFVGGEDIQPLIFFPEAFVFLSAALKISLVAFMLHFMLKRSLPAKETWIFLIFMYVFISPLVWLHYYVILLPVYFWFQENWHRLSKALQLSYHISFWCVYLSFLVFWTPRIPSPFHIFFSSFPLLALGMTFLLYVQHLKNHAVPQRNHPVNLLKNM